MRSNEKHDSQIGNTPCMLNTSARQIPQMRSARKNSAFYAYQSSVATSLCDKTPLIRVAVLLAVMAEELTAVNISTAARYRYPIYFFAGVSLPSASVSAALFTSTCVSLSCLFIASTSPSACETDREEPWLICNFRRMRPCKTVSPILHRFLNSTECRAKLPLET